jgi:cytochrome bd ubiquinol oxidase subunit I
MRAEITDLWALVLNPSTLHRLSHVLIGSFIMGSSFVMSISAWYLLQGRHRKFAEYSFPGALILGTVASLAALAGGHAQARNLHHTQPAKMAAFEGHYHTGPAALSLLGIPDDDRQALDYDISIPGGLSFLLHEDVDAEAIGMDRFRPQDRPSVAVPFFAYHAMVGLGTFFIALTVLASFLQWRGTLYQTRWVLWVFVFALVGAVAANQLGWVVGAEVGRQPWIVHPVVVRDAAGTPQLDQQGHIRYQTYDAPMPDGSTESHIAGLRTQDGVSEVVSGQAVLGSIIMFALIYLLLGLVWGFILHSKIQHGPEPIADARAEDGAPPGDGGLLDVTGAGTAHQGSLTASGEEG